uniref:C2H2-type domain-containing protein n=1 Tax=Meloidogyne floridensis TaxID=298350 RepID=A0A915NJN1_9BILA
MLRRLLSSPLSMNGKVDEDLYGAGDEPKEYFLLSKMQPLPPEEFDQNDLQNYYQQPNFGNNQQQHQQGFSTVAIENDVYWPNFIPLDQCNNGNASNIITINSTSLPPPTHPPQPLFYSTPFHIPSTKNILEEKNFQNDDNCYKNNFVYESTQDGLQFNPDSEAIRKMSKRSYYGDGIERNGESPLLDCDSNDVFYCHYCSRSFPRSRISPTRHVAQCRRLNTNEDGGGGSSSSCSGALMENFGSNTQQRQNTPTTTIDFSSLINANSCSSTSPAPGGIGSVDPTDPYQCSWCQFNTLYKGNMKRHLICCHQVSLESLTNLNFNIERLRRLSTTRPSLDELPILPRRDGKEANNASVVFNNNNSNNNNILNNIIIVKEEMGNLPPQNNLNFDGKNKNNFVEKEEKRKPSSNKRKMTATTSERRHNKLLIIEKQQTTPTPTTSSANNKDDYCYTSNRTIKFAPYI